MDDIQWMLPVNGGTRHKEPLTYQNAKYHCFVTNEEKRPEIQRNGKSLCGKHMQAMDYYETIEGGQMLMFPAASQEFKRLFDANTYGYRDKLNETVKGCAIRGIKEVLEEMDVPHRL